MTEKREWFGGPVDGVVFALIMVMAAFLGRENPRFVYPEILFSFLALLAFNFVNFSILPRYAAEACRAALAVGCNILLLTLVLHFSGGSQSYFWVLYLLPVFNGCLAFARRGVFLTAASVIVILILFQAGALTRGIWAEALELLIKAATIAASAVVVMGVAGREREARRQLEDEQKRIERERVQTREQLQRMDRLAILGTLTAGVAHELNSPLTTILGYTQITLDHHFPMTDARKMFGRIEESARRCRQIIQDMLAFGRQKKGERKYCDVNALIRECVELKEHDWVLEGLQVDEDLAPDLPRTMLFGAEFQQVIFNLLTNAHQAIRSQGKANGRIRLATQRQQDWLLIVVQDNGPGVPPEMAERIWEPFFTTKAEGEGTGLGLAICRKIVQAQGGTLTLETTVGAGAAFLIRLPIVTDGAFEPGGAPAARAPRRAVSKILVADDDPEVRFLLDRLLMPFGMPVESCVDFDQVLSSLRLELPRALVCDLDMPGVGAYEFFQQAQREGFLDSLPVVIISGSPPGPNVEAFIRERGWAQLNKPFEKEAFLETMAKSLGSAGERQASNR